MDFPLCPSTSLTYAPTLPSAEVKSPAATASAAPSSLTQSECATPPFVTSSLVTRHTLSKVFCTVTLKLAVALLPETSVAVQITVVFPTPNMISDPGEHPIETAPGALSVAVGAAYCTIVSDGPVASTVMSGGMLVNVVGISSMTVAPFPLTAMGVSVQLAGCGAG